MDKIKAKYANTTKLISDKILMLRRACNLTQEEFAERIGVDRRTITRAEAGQYRPSGETLEAISLVFDVEISYFYDNSTYQIETNNQELIEKINKKLKTATKETLEKINKIIDII